MKRALGSPDGRREVRLRQLHIKQSHCGHEGVLDEEWLPVVSADGMARRMDGQPILVGHHPEKRHRRQIARMHNHCRVGFARLREAEELALRAGAVGSGGISSDDPDAPDKLRQKVAELQARRDRMKQVNAHWRKHGTIDGLEMGEDERHRIRENQRIWGGLRGPPTP